MKAGVYVLFTLVTFAQVQSAHAQLCTSVGGRSRSLGEFTPSRPTRYWPTGTGESPSPVIAERVFRNMGLLARSYEPHFWRGTVNINMTRGPVRGSSRAPRMDLFIDMGTPLGIDEHDGTFHTQLTSCRTACRGGAPGYRIMMDTRVATGGFADRNTPPRSRINGVAYDFCFLPDPQSRPGWTELHTYVTVYEGHNYDNRMDQFLREQAGSFRRAFHTLYERAHNALLAQELRQQRERAESEVARAEGVQSPDGPALTSGSTASDSNPGH